MGSVGRLEYEQYDLQINKPRPRKFRQSAGSLPKHHIHPVLAALALQNFMQHVEKNGLMYEQCFTKGESSMPAVYQKVAVTRQT